MKTAIKILVPVAILVLAAVLLSGCEDSDLTVSSGGTISVTANPGTVRIDPNVDTPDPDTGLFEGTTMITARVFDDQNLPQEGITVSFQSTASTPLEPASTVTGSNGQAQSLLTLNHLDDPDILVSVLSGGVEGEVAVTLSVVGANEFPQATATLSPFETAQVGQPVIFDGSASTDPDGDITCYQWEILSDNPDDPANNPQIFQGTATSGLSKSFLNEQNLVVTLRVSDKAGLTCATINALNPPGPGNPPEPETAFSPFVFFDDYEITCQNPPPIAEIAGPESYDLVGVFGQTVSLVLDGSLSRDDETPIDDWVWVCGGDLPPQPLGSPAVVRCSYRVLPTATTYVTTLVVKDQGVDGQQIGPNGTFLCQKASEPATVIVNVSPVNP